MDGTPLKSDRARHVTSELLARIERTKVQKERQQGQIQLVCNQSEFCCLIEQNFGT